MTTGPKSGWGGKRTGAGRKPAISLTQKQVKEMLRTARAFAKEKGKTIDQILLGIIYDDQAITILKNDGTPLELPAVEPKVRIAAIKVFKDCTMGRTSEQNVKIEDKRLPIIGLPAMHPDPAQAVYHKEGTA